MHLYLLILSGLALALAAVEFAVQILIYTGRLS